MVNINDEATATTDVETKGCNICQMQCTMDFNHAHQEADPNDKIVNSVTVSSIDMVSTINVLSNAMSLDRILYFST